MLKVENLFAIIENNYFEFVKNYRFEIPNKNLLKTIKSKLRRSFDKKQIIKSNNWGYGVYLIQDFYDKKDGTNFSLKKGISKKDSFFYFCLFGTSYDGIVIEYYSVNFLEGKIDSKVFKPLSIKFEEINDFQKSYATSTQDYRILIKTIRNSINIRVESKKVLDFYYEVLKKWLNEKVTQNKLLIKNQKEKSERKRKIFISHSSKDKKLVTSFVKNVLQLGMGIEQSEIFYTSIENMGIKTGEDFVRKIKEKLIETEITILFISANYKKSEICLNEMGAAWALGKTVLPIKIPPLTFGNIGLLHRNTHCTRIDNSYDLDNLIEQIRLKLNRDMIDPVTWNMNKDNFISSIKKSVSQRKKN